MSRILSYTCWAVAGLLLCCCSSGHCATVRVPGDQPTIQAGIDAASAGDTVLVASGVYLGPGNRDVDLLGKDLAVLSESGSGETIIDCEASPTDPHRGFYLGGATGARAAIQGFTIRNGYAQGGGGGIFCSSTALTLVDCVVEHCRVNTVPPSTPPNGGGGMYCQQSALMVDNCVFITNTAGDWGNGYGRGGGVSCESCSGLFVGCGFEGNDSGSVGGGFYDEGRSDLSFSLCTFMYNVTGDGGAGSGGGFSGLATFEDVAFLGNSVRGGAGGGVSGGGTYRNVTFVGNHADGVGGLQGWGELEVTDCTFTGNGADRAGPGAISCDGGTFEGVVIYGNWGLEGSGAAIRCSGHPTFTNVTIVSNRHEGGPAPSGVLCSGSPVFNRVIIALGDPGWGNLGAVGCADSAHPTFECCDIFGNPGGDWVGCIADLYGVKGNISEDPLFCGPSTGDFTVAENSPCTRSNNGCGVLIGALGAGCSPPSVEATSWGAIKAMFR